MTGVCHWGGSRGLIDEFAIGVGVPNDRFLPLGRKDSEACGVDVKIWSPVNDGDWVRSL